MSECKGKSILKIIANKVTLLSLNVKLFIAAKKSQPSHRIWQPGYRAVLYYTIEWATSLITIWYSYGFGVTPAVVHWSRSRRTEEVNHKQLGSCWPTHIFWTTRLTLFVAGKGTKPQTQPDIMKIPPVQNRLNWGRIFYSTPLEKKAIGIYRNGTKRNGTARGVTPI